MSKLKKLWREQKKYNEIVRLETHNKEEWTTKYLLGLVSEIDEVLREINWKRHRKTSKNVVLSSLAFELADLTKYVLCLWELWGFSQDEMLDWCLIKTDIMNKLLEMENNQPMPKQPVIISDIDGTLGDWRKEFISRAKQQSTDPQETLLIDVDVGIQYDAYVRNKHSFEAGGGYSSIPIFKDAARLLRQAKKCGVYVIIYTARPVNKYKAVQYDTLRWLQAHSIPFDELRFGHEERIMTAVSLRKKGHPVLMLEDDPNLILRADNNNILVWARLLPYNAHLRHNSSNVRWITGEMKWTQSWMNL